MSHKDADRMANSVDPLEQQSDLGLHCLPGLSAKKLGSLLLQKYFIT